MKNKIITILFVIIVCGIFIFNIIIKDTDLSYSERRYLTKFPTITLNGLLNGSVVDQFEEYSSDQFILRDAFRSIKAWFQYNILGKLDNNNLFIEDNHIIKIDYPLNTNKVNSFINKINLLYNTYLKDMNVYYSIIPDKNYYASDNHLKMDYELLFSMVNNGLNYMEYIDITDKLDLSKYYYTDIHWKQEYLSDIVDLLSEKMHFKITNKDYKYHEFNDFKGTYYGQVGLKVPTDKLVYLTNDIIDNASVYDIESNLNTVYEESSLGKMDSYDVFLGGASSIIEITNNSNKSNKELIIFRDSFSSSLAPLLIEGYKKITLVDLRYINMNLLSNYINFDNQDILILYNTSIINSSDMLKIF